MIGATIDSLDKLSIQVEEEAILAAMAPALIAALKAQIKGHTKSRTGQLADSVRREGDIIAPMGPRAGSSKDNYDLYGILVAVGRIPPPEVTGSDLATAANLGLAGLRKGLTVRAGVRKIKV